MEMFSDNMSDTGSGTRLIKAPAKDSASPLNQDVEDLLDRALDDSDDYDDDDDATSFI